MWQRAKRPLTVAFRDLLRRHCGYERREAASAAALFGTGDVVMTERVSFGPRPDRVTRGWGGLAALAYPALLIGLSLSVGFRRGGDLTDFGASFVGSILFLVAAPLAWVFAFEFIDVTRFTVLVVGSLSGAVLWYQLGRAIADRSNTWARCRSAT